MIFSPLASFRRFANPRFILLLAVGLVAAASTATGSCSAEETKPNFVVINIDDLGYADIAPFGSKRNRTPNLDRLAAEGMKLTSFYAAPVCSPSRASLMTGCYPKRALPIPHVLFPENAVGLAPQEITVAEILKRQGYATGCIGKWHLGDQPKFLPTNQGFDYYYGLPYSNDMGPAEDGVKSNLGEPLPKNAKRAQPPLPLMRNETVLQRVLPEDQQKLVENYTNEATQFLRKHQNENFFLYLPHSAVHFPIYPGKKFQGRSPHGYYSDWVEEVDWSVGEVLNELTRLGLDEKTLVLFTSDNGGTRRGVNDPLRGFKASTWEGGVRVPTIVRWTGRIPAGTSSDAITGMFDVLPTFATLAGAKLPKGRKLDGRDLSGILLATDDNPPEVHDRFYYYRGLNLEAVRYQHWKLHLPKKELYNLAEDIGETTNLADAHPDAVERLMAVADEMADDLGLEGIGPGCRPLGQVKMGEAKPLIDFEGNIREGFAPDEN